MLRLDFSETAASALCLFCCLLRTPASVFFFSRVLALSLTFEFTKIPHQKLRHTLDNLFLLAKTQSRTRKIVSTRALFLNYHLFFFFIQRSIFLLSTSFLSFLIQLSIYINLKIYPNAKESVCVSTQYLYSLLNFFITGQRIETMNKFVQKVI